MTCEFYMLTDDLRTGDLYRQCLALGFLVVINKSHAQRTCQTDQACDYQPTRKEEINREPICAAPVLNPTVQH